LHVNNSFLLARHLGSGMNEDPFSGLYSTVKMQANNRSKPPTALTFLKDR